MGERGLHAETYVLMLETRVCLCTNERARARATLYICVGAEGGGEGGRARGDPFFSVSPVLSSHPFYARALLC